MKLKRKKKENNLGYSQETKILVFLYRKFEFDERGAHKFAPNFDEAIKEEIKEDFQLAKELFICYSLDAMYEKNSPYKDVNSNEIGRWAALYRILKKEGLLEEVVAHLAYIYLEHEEPSIEDTEKYVSHLRYYLNHPEIHYEYKLTKRNYVKDIMEAIKPQYDKLISILQRKGHLKETEIKEVEELAKFLKEKDNNFDIRTVVLEDFFNSEDGLKLSEEAKIEIALKLGALDKSAIHYYGEDGNLIK